MEMKTILIAHNYTQNSFASMSFNLAHHLAKLGNRVVFISHKPFFKDMKIIKSGKGEVILFSWSSEKRPTSFNDVFWFVKIYLKYKPEAVIGHFVGSNITIAISKLLSFGKVKSLTYYHTLTNQILTDSKNSYVKRELLFFRKKIFYKLFCDVIVCPSKLAKIDLESSFSVTNGIIVLNPMSDRFTSKKNNPKDNIVVSYLGRLDDSKGVLEMIEGFTEYIEKNKDSKIKLEIAGSGTKQKDVISLIDNNDFIKYIGGLKYDEIDNYLKKSHFVIIPSKIDNLPTVGLEAMMNGTPLLISYSTGLTAYLEEEKECFKFHPNAESIVEVFHKVERTFEIHEAMCTHARKTYLNLFSMDNYCKEFSKILL